MTKKDYILISKVLASHISDGAKCFDSEQDCRAIVESFADELKAENPKFNTELFLKACGVENFASYEDNNNE